jgi:hypothetical protein
MMQNELNQFVDYMMSFYGNQSNSLYPELNFTKDEILKETLVYISGIEEFCGDSVDREFVRDRILANRLNGATL